MNARKMLLEYLDLTRSKYKPSTQDTHLRFTNHLLDCFRTLKIKRLKDIDLSTGYKMVEYYKNETSNKNNSINKNLNYLKAVMKHYEIYTSFLEFKSLPKDTKPFKRFYHEELDLIMRYLDLLDSSDNSIVYKTFVFLALDSGMRKSELLNIKISNIDFYREVIYLEETKTGKHRYAPFSRFSSQKIKDLIELDPNREYLMMNFIRNRRLSKNDIKLFYRRLKDKLQLQRIHTHRFRKTFASLLADNGMPPQYVQVLLDHKNIHTTMKYIQFSKITPLEKYHEYNEWDVNKKSQRLQK